MIGTGIIGYGYAGRVFHAPLIARTAGLVLEAVCSRDEQRRALAQQQWGVKTYSHPEELLDDPDVHLVVIATPHDTHYSLADLALQAGKHVVVDKPFTLFTEEADRLIEQARRCHRMISVFHNRRWDGDFLTLQQVIQEGTLGEVWWVESCVGRYGHSRRWRTQRDSMGSLLHDWGAHLIDQTLQLMGMPCRISARRNFRMWRCDVESFFRVEMEYPGERTCVVEVNYLRAVERPRWYVLGDTGGLIQYGLDPQEKALAAGEVTPPTEPPDRQPRLWLLGNGEMVEQTLPSVRGDWGAYYRNVAAHLLHGEPLAVRPEQARQVILLIEYALRSAEEARPLEIPPSEYNDR